jgi:signal transduction histidine kinase/CheY-like chemotaxis protein
MTARILSVAVTRETDIIVARQRTRRIAELLGFDAQDQTRITTAVSEIVRNALDYGGGGRVDYALAGRVAPQSLVITVQDGGPGIADPAAILDGRHHSDTGMGIGITGARRLLDDFQLTTAPGQGTTVTMAKTLPKRTRPLLEGDLGRLAADLARGQDFDPTTEIRQQNHELMVQFQELQARQEELSELNQELQDTNRGVVALYAELEDRADYLRRADQLKTRFLSNMSHEFRTPLNSILSLSRLLLSRIDGELSGEQEKQVLFIRRAAENLAELVNDLLDLAKVEAGKTVVKPRKFAIDDLFGALRGMLRPLLVGDAVALNFDEEVAGIPPLVTDEDKVSQILRNFISNALKFTERGEVRIWAEYDQVEDSVTFCVRDTGIGIAEKDIPTLWEEFGQVPSRLQSKVKGTGLGLPLSRKLAAVLRGDIRVESAPGQGSVFSLTLPRIHAPLAGQPSAAALPTLEPGRSPVLVVEDDPADAFSVERALAQSRYQVISARTVTEAKHLLEHTSPTAILLDVMLDGEESWSFLLEMKQGEKSHHVPVVVVSSGEEERKARSFGANEYLSKPVDPGALIRLLDDLTGAGAATRIMLVDDEEISRYLIRQLLPAATIDLTEVASGSEGLRIAADSPPDVILLDLNMDGMNGFEFLERATAMPELRHVPILAMTSMLLTDDQRLRLAKADAVVSKFELTADALATAIREALAAPRRERS